MEVLFLVALVFVLLSFPKSGSVHPNGHLTSSRIIYSGAMCLLIFSPLYTIYLIDFFGGAIGSLRSLPLIVLAASLSFPASMGIARLGGPKRYSDYVSLVEGDSKVTLSKLMIVWLAVFSVLFGATLLASIISECRL